eukprot:4858836-Amphidinium_carterae.3
MIQPPSPTSHSATPLRSVAILTAHLPLRLAYTSSSGLTSSTANNTTYYPASTTTQSMTYHDLHRSKHGRLIRADERLGGLSHCRLADGVLLLHPHITTTLQVNLVARFTQPKAATHRRNQHHQLQLGYQHY